MDNSAALLQQIMGDKETLILLLTVATGFLIGKAFRLVAKVMFSFFAVLLFFIFGLQYVGFINITINYDSVALFMQTVYNKLSAIGLSEQAFFWVPFIYSLRKSRIPSIS
ncbi:MAG: hypothetical protein H6696_06245 [Deferribacteres bacterium]|nr:hypothetical protein [candidate division KSB1 bacterium]MCB9501519.1 hypothetical protein [Deferribacteres bacterium]